MTTIFAATDLTTNSDMAVKSALTLAKLIGAKARLVHFDDFTPVYFGHDLAIPYAPDYAEVKEWETKIALPVLARIDEMFKRLGLNKNDTRLDVVSSSRYKDLDAFLVSNQASLLVTSASTKSGVERFFLGSFLEKAIFNLTTNILLIKKEITELPKNITMSIDLENDDSYVFNTATSMAKSLKAKLNLVHTLGHTPLDMAAKEYSQSIKEFVEGRNQHSDNALEELKQKAIAQGVECEKALCITVGKTAEQDIQDYLKANPTDLLFIQPHPGLFKGFHAGSTSFALIKHLDTNFFIVKGKDILQIS
jgi:nucleotide-binding universal stress UspA family protein